MSLELQKIVNSFVSKMEDVNEKKLETCSREVNFAIQEVKAFNEFRQNLHLFEKMDLKQELSKRDQEVKDLKKSYKDLADDVKEIKEKITKKRKSKGKDGIPKNQ